MGVYTSFYLYDQWNIFVPHFNKPLKLVTGASGQDYCYPALLNVIFLGSEDHIFSLKMSKFDVFLFQYITPIPEINGFDVDTVLP